MNLSLRDIPFLSDASREALTAAEAETERFSLPGGAALFRTGEAPEGLYFVVSGSLAAFAEEEKTRPRLIGFIRPGEPVGEMAQISGEPHSASVYAVRDSEVVRLPPRAFDRLAQSHPMLIRRLAKTILTRARQATRPRAEPKVYALIGASRTIDLKLRAQALVEALARLGRKACIVGEEASDMLSVWYDALEQGNDAVFLVSPIADTPWFRICLRQADRIWILARGDAVPSDPLLPGDPSPARQFQLVDLVLLHHGAERTGASVEQWRRACGATRIFHWRDLDPADCARLARVVAGVSVGLVLSGGGARAYAHLGVLRALREAKVPVDSVGGTSMGGIVAACYAMGWTDDEIERRIRAAFVATNPLGDYVLPVVSLSRGKRVEHRLQEHFGETQIEDLRLPFFCVSADLVSGRAFVHRTGKLREKLRASISLPGILPPVATEDGRALLVDGAVVKNFPVDVMAEHHRGAIVGVDVARRSPIEPARFANPPSFLGWVARRGFQSYPPIVELLMYSATVAAPSPNAGRERADMLITPEIPGVALRDWRRFDEAVAAGYEATVEALQTHGASVLDAALSRSSDFAAAARADFLEA